jgi:hypothetical protein
MRYIGFILVILGALALGYQGFTFVTPEKVGGDEGQTIRKRAHTIWIPPVVSGIVVVSGLLLIATDSRRCEHLS